MNQHQDYGEMWLLTECLTYSYFLFLFLDQTNPRRKSRDLDKMVWMHQNLCTIVRDPHKWHHRKWVWWMSNNKFCLFKLKVNQLTGEFYSFALLTYLSWRWTWWHIGRVAAFHPKGHGFDSRFSYHVGALDKSFNHSCLWRFGTKFRQSIIAVSGAPLSSRGLEEALQKYPEWMNE